MSMHPPPDPDELASDLVDGLLPADQAARLRADPAIAARVAAIEAARAALRVPPPSPPGAVDRALAATFAALDRGTLPVDEGVGPGERPPPPVTHLRTESAPSAGPPAAGGPWAPAHRAKRDSNSMPWLAAAAAIVLLGLVTIGILSGGSGSDGDDTAASVASQESSGDAGAADESPAAQPQDDTQTSGESAGDAAPSGSEGATAPTTSAAPQVSTSARSDLGAVDDAAELAARVRSASRTASPDSSFTEEDSELGNLGADAQSCLGLTADGDPSRGTSTYVADAVLAGVPVRVHIYDPGDGDLRLVATDRSCVDLVDQPYSD
jgi:hypothetical protein